MRIREIKKEAWVALKNKWGLAVLLTILLGIFTFVIPDLFSAYASGGLSNYYLGDTYEGDITSLIVGLILYPAVIGYNWVFLSLIRREPQGVKSMFHPFAVIGTYLKLIGTTILIWLFTALWTMLLIVPGIIKGLAYSQTYYVLKDNPDLPILHAITESRRLMDGYKWKFFLLQLSFIGWIILAILTLGLGFLWLTPYMTASSAEFYNEIRQAKADDGLNQ
ncbi:Uncharacterized membrane protein [Fictibacillus enclensis]|uniref:DUF975 domain-containing protein n=1 Tax=Fictibacillus enclensis TaxID=1017270 RepID=A0A0V8J7K3_9BACL|nr:DUF975 family protein [Fictibacillus enclensis]KSU83054.1 hypothetical protein AS030_10715 [Fictibacillus enclensis]SCC09405.1 Uncharacterized membrane protein [Fictibacillus enclensis]